MKLAVQFGAGNIGRGFIGAVLAKSGYQVVFADVVKDLVDRINADRQYTVHIKDVDSEDILAFPVSALWIRLPMLWWRKLKRLNSLRLRLA